MVRPFGKAFINSLRAVGSAPSDSVTVSVWKGAGSFGTRSHGIHGSSKRGWDRGVKEIGVVKRWMKMRKKELLGDDSMV